MNLCMQVKKGAANYPTPTPYSSGKYIILMVDTHAVPLHKGNICIQTASLLLEVQHRKLMWKFNRSSRFRTYIQQVKIKSKMKKIWA